MCDKYCSNNREFLKQKEASPQRFVKDCAGVCGGQAIEKCGTCIPNEDKGLKYVFFNVTFRLMKNQNMSIVSVQILFSGCFSIPI